MKIAFYSTKPYDRIYFEPKSQEYDMQLHFYETGCNEETIPLAKGHAAICIFFNVHLNEKYDPAAEGNGNQSNTPAVRGL